MLNVIKQIGKSVCYVALYFGMQIFVVMAATVGYSFILGLKLAMDTVASGTEYGADEEVLNQIILDGVMGMQSLLMIFAAVLTLLCLWVFFVIRKKKITEEANLKPFDKKYWPAVLTGSVGLCLLVNFGMNLLPIPEDVLMEYAEASEGLMEGPFVLLLIANAIMAPVVEEILFRGLVFGRMRRAMPLWTALILSSVFFGLMHGQILWICYTTLVGLILGLVAWKTDSVWAPMFMHFAFNLFGTCISYLVEEVTASACLVLTGVGALCLVVMLILILKKYKNPALSCNLSADVIS